MQTTSNYLNLVPAEHQPRPKFMATVAFSVTPYVDGFNVALSLITLFDIDTAVGQQLDFTGQWIGLTRFVDIIDTHWFSFDREGLGFDEGRWFTPYETGQVTVELADDTGDPISYRRLLKARIVANHWDGTINGEYAAWNTLFEGTDYRVLIQDGLAKVARYFSFDIEHAGFDEGAWYQPGLPIGVTVAGNMHLIEALIGPALSRVTEAIFTGDYLGLKSAGVEITYVIQNQGAEGEGTSGIGLPLFGFDVGPDSAGATYPPTPIAGFDSGAWGEIIVPTATPPLGAA